MLWIYDLFYSFSKALSVNKTEWWYLEKLSQEAFFMFWLENLI